MNARKASDLDRQSAKIRLDCPVCRQARTKQQGMAYWIINHVEAGLCPFCRAYDRVYGRKSHEAGKQKLGCDR